DAGKIGANDFYQIASGVVRDAPGDALAPLLIKIAALPGGSGIAFDILHMHQSCAVDDGKDLDPVLITCGRRLLRTADFSEEGMLGDYGVKEVAEVCLAGSDGEADARI